MFYPKKKQKRYCNVEPTDISVLLQMCLDKHHLSDAISLEVLNENFENIVGTLLLQHVKIEKFEKGILTIKSESAVWKQELFLQKKTIVQRCNQYLEKNIVKNILFL